LALVTRGCRRILASTLGAVAAALLGCAVAWAQEPASPLHQDHEGQENPDHAIGQCADCHAAGERLPTKGMVMETVLLATDALVKQDKESLVKELALPLTLAAVSPDGAVNVEQITQEMIDQFQPGQAPARPPRVRLGKMRCEPLAYNVAAAWFDMTLRGAPVPPLQDSRWLALLTRDAGQWKIAVAASGPISETEIDADTRAAIDGLIKAQIQAFITGDRDKYLSAYADEVATVTPEWGARMAGRQELLAAFQGLSELMAQGGITKAEVDDVRVSALGPNVVSVDFMARGLDDAGTQVGHRQQVYILTKQGAAWHIIAEAVGMPEEGA
jgi:uncharacterized protein (TIGR02246 family)